jgi:hypothetical protein
MRRLIPVLTTVLVVTAPALAQPIVASTQAEPAPAEIAEPLRALLAGAGGRVQIGDATLTFWWVKLLPLAATASAAPEWASVAEGSLVGAVQVSTSFRDVRGRTIKPGVYTLRFGIQPQDGDHLGVSSYRDFLLLSPAAVDQDPAPTGHDGTIRMSKQTLGASHPGVWMLDPPTTTAAPLTSGTNDMKFDYVVFEVTTTGGAMRFGLVVKGKVET